MEIGGYNIAWWMTKTITCTLYSFLLTTAIILNVIGIDIVSVYLCNSRSTLLVGIKHIRKNVRCVAAPRAKKKIRFLIGQKVQKKTKDRRREDYTLFPVEAKFPQNAVSSLQ